MEPMTVADRKELGRARRQQVPRAAHAEWRAPTDRRDPIVLLEEQDADRLQWLVPLRHARMAVSAFTFYRGTARIMAADLASTPVSGLDAQLGGDAHLSNFGAYASPERSLVFDQNDFDETLPGPWEWDLKRLATSIMIAGEYLGFTPRQRRRATAAATASYRESMARYAKMGLLDLWYDFVTVDDVGRATKMTRAERDARVERFKNRAMSKNSLKALKKLAVEVEGRYRIRTDPPVLYSLRDLPTGYDPIELEAAAMAAFEGYKETLRDARHAFLDRYTVVDIGMKVVGVGSVGTRCLILLLMGRDDHDPLFLQAKEAGPSVLEGHLPASTYPNHGQRVVEGQLVMQAQSDIFLGWTAGRGPDERHFYLRQLRDWKGSVEIEGGSPHQLEFYGGLCGLTLARGHARSGDAEAIRAYCGKGDQLDEAVTAFAEAYSAQNQSDYELFQEAIRSGRLEASASID